MRETGRDFADVLAEAQAAGYAEADPSFDVDGIDAAHKLALLAGAGLRRQGQLRRRSMSRASAASPSMDIALRRGAGLPHQAARPRARDRRTASSSACIPAWCRSTAPIAHIEGVFNAVVVEGDFVGKTMFQGRGAGQGRPPRRWSPTSSTWRAGGTCRPSSCRRDELADKKAAPMAPPCRRLLHPPDGAGPAGRDRRRLGGAARGAHLARVDAAARRGPQSGEVPVVLTTHETEEARDAACAGADREADGGGRGALPDPHRAILR